MLIHRQIRKTIYANFGSNLKLLSIGINEEISSKPDLFWFATDRSGSDEHK